MKLTPIGDRVVVERIKPVSEDHGIYIPEAMRPDSKWGRVMSLGAGKPDFTFTVKPGDLVRLPKTTWADIEWQGKRFVILSEGDLLAISSKA